MRLVLCLVLLSFCAVRTAGAAVFSVGADAACTHSNLLSALSAASANGAGLDEIRLATNLTYTSIIAPVASHSVHVRGGFASCASTSPTGRTRVVGATAGSGGTFTTSGNGAAYELELENLELRDTLGAIGRRGGALRIEGNFEVRLRNTIISGNRAGRGGGVYIDGGSGAQLSIAADSIIANNTATIGGGGLYCQGEAIVFLSSALIAANVAEDGSSDPGESGNGGGVALHSGCSMVQRGTLGIRGVRANTAARHGGGYFLRNEAGLVLNGTSERAAEISDNLAAAIGGGIAVLDDFAPLPRVSTVRINDGWIETNLAPDGAGIGLVTGGDVVMQTVLDVGDCEQPVRCSSLSRNESQGGTCRGAAAYLGAHSRMRLQRSRVEQNCTGKGGSSFVVRLDARLQVDSSLVVRNGGAPFQIFNEDFTGLLEIAWSTVTDNFDGARVGFIGVPNQPGATGTLRLFGSILGEPFQQMTAVIGIGNQPPMTFQYDCLMLDTFFSATLPSSTRTFELAPPYGLAAPASGDYRPASASSPLVDWCDGSLAPRIDGDYDGVAAIYDVARPNQFGAHDVGAYERVANLAQDIFADGFE